MKKIFTLFLALVASVGAMAGVHTYDFSQNGAGFYKDAALTEAIETGSANGLAAFYAADGKKFTADKAANCYFNAGYQDGPGYLMLKQPLTLTLPTYEGEKITSIVFHTSASGSTAVKVAVNDGFVTICAATTLATQDADYTFEIPATSMESELSLVVSNKNAQCTKLTINTVSASAETVNAPAFSVAGGTFTEAQSVELSCSTEGAEIHYTLDGTEPTAASTLYTAAINVTETTTIKAIAVKGGVESIVVSATYQIITTQGQGTEESPYTVSDVVMLNNNGANAWVVGTICGVYANNEATDDAEAISKTPSNIALTDGEKVIPVQLPAGDVRAALNLVDNPGNLGATVKIKGDLVAYFSTTGLKNAKEFVLDATGIKSVSANNNNEIYNLAGQRVAKAQKGLYIIGGKKVVK